MAATIINELLIILGILYFISCVLMGMLIYMLIIVRVVDFYLHPEAFKKARKDEKRSLADFYVHSEDEEDHEL